MIKKEIKDQITAEVEERFCRYVQVFTTSDPDTKQKPSTSRQMDLIRLLEQELRDLGLSDVEVDEKGFLYAILPSSDGMIDADKSFCLLSHVDTSPDQPGNRVMPQIHRRWDGSPIRFPHDAELILTTDDSPELLRCVGEDIITASGLTLLGADDKAGVAEIMTAVGIFQKYPDIEHPEIRICFTTDEEVGRGIEGIRANWLPKYCYTMDGGFPGEIEIECFDAWKVKFTFRGQAVHPGVGYEKMINAVWAAGFFVSTIPWDERPERTKERQGFYHLVEMKGNAEKAEATVIVRDFAAAENQRRLSALRQLCIDLAEDWPGIIVDIEETYQYQNMYEVLKDHPEVTERAKGAIQDAGLVPIQNPIRGGTDGSRLTVELGKPTPNIFAGGMLFHSRKEWIAVRSMALATETIIYLGGRWR